jgi:methionyl-tRNA formyltransferase
VLSIVLIAEESAGIQVLRALAKTEHRIHAVLTGDGRHGPLASVGAVARSLGLDVQPASRVRDASLAAELAAAKIDLLLNVHSLYLVHETVLAVPAIGAFNLHPGPLPRYAGLNCPSWAIYHGERSYGVTVHRMSRRIDAGSIAYAASFDVDDADTGFRLTARCIRAGVPLVLRLVETAAVDPRAIPIIAQDLGHRRYFGREAPRRAAIGWSESATRIAALVRACDYTPFPSPWGHAHACYEGRRIEIVEVACSRLASDAPPGSVRVVAPPMADVATADAWLTLRSVRYDGHVVAPARVLRHGAHLEDGAAP